jgi:hypothetical protein
MGAGPLALERLSMTIVIIVILRPAAMTWPRGEHSLEPNHFSVLPSGRPPAVALAEDADGPLVSSGERRPLARSDIVPMRLTDPR